MQATQGVSQQTRTFDDPMDLCTEDRMDLCAPEEQSEPISAPPSEECVLIIFSHLDHAEVVNASQVSRQWRDVAAVESVWKAIFYRELVFFGEKDWNELGYKVDKPQVDSYRSITIDALSWAKSKWPKEWDRKMMFLKPKEITLLGTTQAIPLTPIVIGLIIAPKLGVPCKPGGYADFFHVAKQEHGQKGLQEFCFVYMTPDVIPNSRGESDLQQAGLVQKFDGLVPDLLSVVIGIFLKAYKTGVRLFPVGDKQKLLTFTRCKEITWSAPLMLGSEGSTGIKIDFGGSSHRNIGIAALQKFLVIPKRSTKSEKM